MLKMNRLTAYDSSVRPMITWKVRGRSSSQTPEPASTPMARASTTSIRPRSASAAARAASRSACSSASDGCAPTGGPAR